MINQAAAFLRLVVWLNILLKKKTSKHIHLQVGVGNEGGGGAMWKKRLYSVYIKAAIEFLSIVSGDRFLRFAQIFNQGIFGGGKGQPKIRLRSYFTTEKDAT